MKVNSGRIFLLLLCVSGGGASCRSKKDIPVGPVDPEWVIQVSSFPLTLDPAKIEDGLGIRMVKLVSRSLFTYDARGNRIPDLIDHVETLEEDRHYRFHLKKDLHWSNGKPLTWTQIINGWIRSAHPQTRNQMSDLFTPFKRAKKIIISATEMEMTLPEKIPYALDRLTLPQSFPAFAPGAKSADFLRDHSLPGMGPYILEKTVPGQELVFKRLEVSPVYPARIRFLVVSDESMATRLFNEKRLDVVTRIPVAELPLWKSDARLHRAPFFATYFYSFNFRLPPFRDLHFRQQIAKNINREALMRVGDLSDVTSTGWIPRGLPGAFAAWPATAIEASQKGEPYRAKGKPQRIKLSIDAGDRNLILAEKVQYDLRQSMNLDIQIEPRDWKEHVTHIHSGAAAFFRWGWSTPYRDPLHFLECFESRARSNFSGYRSAVFDALVNKVREANTAPEREAALQKAHLFLLTEAVVIPIFFYNLTYLANPELNALQLNPFGYFSVMTPE